MMAQSIREIRSDIENTKVLISKTYNELENRVTQLSDWRYLIHEYPFASVFGAMVAGVMLVQPLKVIIKPLREGFFVGFYGWLFRRFMNTLTTRS